MEVLICLNWKDHVYMGGKFHDGLINGRWSENRVSPNSNGVSSGSPWKWPVGCIPYFLKSCSEKAILKLETLDNFGILADWQTFGYGSIPIDTIFRGMNIHLPAILMFTRGTRFWHTAISHSALLRTATGLRSRITPGRTWKCVTYELGVRRCKSVLPWNVDKITT